jgi:hypothetical protein
MTRIEMLLKNTNDATPIANAMKRLIEDQIADRLQVVFSELSKIPGITHTFDGKKINIDAKDQESLDKANAVLNDHLGGK